MSYVYLKRDSRSRSRLNPQKKKFLAVILFSLGISFFGFALLPIIQFQIEYSSRFSQILNPISSKFYHTGGSILGDVDTDYTQLSNWFVNSPDSTASSIVGEPVKYLLSIPKLKITDAEVIIGSLDLKKSLIQYPNTALPGQVGSPVIFGHSVLPQFFNPKSYLTIFSTLYKLKIGDEIDLSYDGIAYRYLIEEMYEVQPSDLSVLEQRFDGRYLTVITCSPPGTYLRRLVVKARLSD